LAAVCIQILHLNNWIDSPDAARAQSVDYARRAVRAAVDDPFVLASAAVVLGYFGEDIDAAIALMDRSLAANPSSAYAWFFSGVLQECRAARHCDRAYREFDAA
jgi:adenylate cyclase